MDKDNIVATGGFCMPSQTLPDVSGIERGGILYGPHLYAPILDVPATAGKKQLRQLLRVQQERLEAAYADIRTLTRRLRATASDQPPVGRCWVNESAPSPYICSTPAAFEVWVRGADPVPSCRGHLADLMPHGSHGTMSARRLVCEPHRLDLGLVRRARADGGGAGVRSGRHGDADAGRALAVGRAADRRDSRVGSRCADDLSRQRADRRVRVVSSVYRTFCLSHTPALEVGEHRDAAGALLFADQMSEPGAQHHGCDLVVGRYSGALVELTCRCKYHTFPLTVDADVARLVLRCLQQSDDARTHQLARRAARCWTSDRLHSLRDHMDAQL